jgi:drug/metabolite transporter (DMT)-like permease
LPQPDNPLHGIALSVSACAVFAIADTTSKYISVRLPITEMQWIRYMLFLGMAAILATRAQCRALRPHNPKLRILRGLCVTGRSVLFVYGIREMTMA